MSMQNENAEKLNNEANVAAMQELFNGPDSKRIKIESSLFGGGNGKLKYDDYGYKSDRGSMGLDLSSSGDKRMSLDSSGLNLSGMSQPDFSAFAKSTSEMAMNHKNKEMSLKGYGQDLSKNHEHSKADLSMAAISPLTSLSHLSGMGGLAQSPLALSFNDIASNLNLLAQLNPVKMFSIYLLDKF